MKRDIVITFFIFIFFYFMYIMYLKIWRLDANVEIISFGIEPKSSDYDSHTAKT